MNIIKPSPMQILKILIGLVSLTLVLFLSTTSYGQGNNQQPLKKKKENASFKIYTNLGLAKGINTSRWNTTSLTILADKYNTRPVGYFTPAFTVETPKQNFHEFELSRIVLRSEESEMLIEELIPGLEEAIPMQKTSEVLIAIKYEYNLMIGTLKRHYNTRPYIGFAFTPYIANSKITPLTSAGKKTSETNFGSTLSITPRVSFVMNKKFFLDLNIPITMAQINVEQFKGDNRAHSTNTEYSTLPGILAFRVGLGMKL